MARPNAMTPFKVSSSNTALWNRKSVRQGFRIWGGTIVLLAGAFVMMVPLAWMLSTSLKADGEVFLIPIRWIPSKILMSNYPAAITFVPYVQFFLNSV